MQGIYQGFEIFAHDAAWTAALDLTQNSIGLSNINDTFRLIEMSGRAEVKKW